MRVCMCTLGNCTRCGAGCCRDCTCKTNITITTTGTRIEPPGWVVGNIVDPDFSKPINIPTAWIEEYCMGKIEKQSAKRVEKRKALIKAFGGKCSKCAGVFPDCAMDFHHTDPANKRFHIALSQFTRKWEDLLNEASKCILLCANCHRITHYKQEVNNNDILEGGD